MALKYSELEKFRKHLFIQGFTNEINDHSLDVEIGKFFDRASDYAIIAVRKALSRFGFLTVVRTGIWRMNGMEVKDDQNGV